MQLSPLLDQLIQSFQCLPGVGPKSAQRLALHLLDKDRYRAKRLAETLLESLEHIHHCQRCRAYTEQPLCDICSDNSRDQSLLCVIENPLDLIAIEHIKIFDGYYFVLHGHISPLDGVGPEKLGLDQLQQHVEQQAIEEVILATSATLEGEATAHYIVEILKHTKPALKISRIAQGVPVGSELDMSSPNTLSYALADRKLITEQAC